MHQHFIRVCMVFSELNLSPLPHLQLIQMWSDSHYRCTVESNARVLSGENKPETLLQGHMKQFSNLSVNIFKSSSTPYYSRVTFTLRNQTKSSLTLNPGSIYNIDLDISAPTAPILWSSYKVMWRHPFKDNMQRLHNSKYIAEKNAQ